MKNNLIQLKYPIGQFQKPDSWNLENVSEWIDTIESFPQRLIDKVFALSSHDKKKTYREGSWTVAQLVHHCVDSHMNSMIRFKWALTEDSPTIKSYKEALWCELPDALEEDLQASLDLLSALHIKWTYLLRNLSKDQLELTWFHPDDKAYFSLAQGIALYAWHCNRHLAHIDLALQSD